VAGFTDAVQRHGIKTIVNLQDDYADPNVRNSYLDRSTTSEIEMCRRLGVQYVFIPPDLIAPQNVGPERPKAIDQFLTVMDDPKNYPVLIHCKAGLHRTGVMVAVYRMEYQGYSPRAALDEVKANGFGEFAASSANAYIVQYILSFTPGIRIGATEVQHAAKR
jgi:protein tyrosine/serine phosphatase